MAVNAPQAGVLKEFLANEEDTVLVDQEIAKIDAGAAKPEGTEKPESKGAPKEEKKDASTDARPAPAENKPESKPESQPSQSSPAPQPKKESPPPKQTSKETSAASGPVLGSREERRVCLDLLNGVSPVSNDSNADRLAIGQDESYATPYRRAPQAVSKHRCFLDHL